MGSLVLVCTIIGIGLVSYFDFNDPAKNTAAAGNVSVGPVAANASFGAGVDPCNSRTKTPFGNSSPCVDTPIARRAVDGRMEDPETRAMIESAQNGNISQFDSYWNYSRNCRRAHAKMDEERMACDLAALEADDVRFMKQAEGLAAAGDTQAQVALGQLWLAAAMWPTGRLAVTAQETSHVGSPSHSLDAFPQPRNVIVLNEDGSTPVDPAFRSPDILLAAQKAAYFFSKAAPESPDSQSVVQYLESKGVRPYIK